MKEKRFGRSPTRSEQQILTNVSFSIAVGQKLALVGPSGSGKSTIASLIERFYEFDSGTIYLGSYSLASINSQWLRQNISFVNQEPSLFTCSICDNITFGLDSNQISFDDIICVAKQANAGLSNFSRQRGIMNLIVYCCDGSSVH
ncbi:unnamed protein product [Rotaria sp. Silwood1]|nr:unnamed protein product [Rotaria sp. Silwood1]